MKKVIMNNIVVLFICLSLFSCTGDESFIVDNIKSTAAMVVGNNGAILKSNDGSLKEWEKITQSAYNGINFTSIAGNRKELIVVGTKGTILISTDQGINWKTITPQDSADQNITFTKVIVYQNQYFVVGYLNQSIKVVKLDSNSTTFSSFSITNTTTTSRASITFNKDLNQLLIVADNNFFAFSNDNGNSWIKGTNNPGALYAVIAIGDKYVIGGYKGKLSMVDNKPTATSFSTKDLIDSTKAPVNINNIAFINDIGIAVGNSWTIIMGNTNSNSWTINQIKEFQNFNFTDICAYKNSYYFLATSSSANKILTTTNGKDINTIYSEANAGYNSIILYNIDT